MSNKTLVKCSGLTVSRISSRFTACIPQPLTTCVQSSKEIRDTVSKAQLALIHSRSCWATNTRKVCTSDIFPTRCKLGVHAPCLMPVAAHKQAICAHLRECTFMNVLDTTVRVLTSHMHKHIPRCAGALERYSLRLIARALLHPIVWVLVLLNATVKRSLTELSYIPLGKWRVPLSQRWLFPLSQSRKRLVKFGGQP